MSKTVRTKIRVQAVGGKNADVKPDRNYFEFIAKFPYGTVRASVNLSNSEVEKLTTEEIAKFLNDAIWNTMRKITRQNEGGAK